jgi:transcriptional regulator with GAF, ATPase, and Fis domain
VNRNTIADGSASETAPIKTVVHPRLIGLDGPLQGRVIALDVGELSIGRHPSNTVAIRDPSVSRRHCVFRKQADLSVRIADCNSRNGTFVNGLPVQERTLEHGDEIRLGGCRLLFLVRQEEEESPPSAFLRKGEDIETRTMFQIPRQQSLYLEPKKALAAATSTPRLARNLEAMLRVSMTVRASSGVEVLARQLIEIVFDATPASEAAILLFDSEPGEPAWSFGRRRDSETANAVEAHGPLVKQCYEEDLAILSQGHKPDQEGGVRRSMLAAPLAGSEKPLGVIYLASSDARVEFDEDHLQLVTAIGSVSGRALETALYCEGLSAENRRLRQEIDLEHDMVGESPMMQDVYRFIAKVAPAEATVLIYGESGTGKELVARAIHRNSPRATRPFVAINCAALTETLLESELFGHEKGAFTGAVALKKGKLEVADGGTVFLDEIGEVPLALQVKLLRAIQEREFERVGGTRPVRVNVRWVAATNRDLRAAIRRGTFRDDLFYRLNVVSVQMPPLRDRRSDIPLLAAYFADKFGRRVGRKNPGVSPQARTVLMNYDWPGNVRELENAIERAVVLGSTDLILPEDLPETILDPTPPEDEATGRLHGSLREEKRRVILQAIRDAGGSQMEAARMLGINATYLSRLIRHLDLKDELRRSAQA